MTGAQMDQATPKIAAMVSVPVASVVTSCPNARTSPMSPSTSSRVVRGLMEHGRMAPAPSMIVPGGTNGVSWRSRFRLR
jgi:hypothetical protein